VEYFLKNDNVTWNLS